MASVPDITRLIARIVAGRTRQGRSARRALGLAARLRAAWRGSEWLARGVRNAAITIHRHRRAMPTLGIG